MLSSSRPVTSPRCLARTTGWALPAAASGGKCSTAMRPSTGEAGGATWAASTPFRFRCTAVPTPSPSPPPPRRLLHPRGPPIVSGRRELSLGALSLGAGRCQFRVWAPHVERVEVHLVSPRERLPPPPKEERGGTAARPGGG